MIYTDEAKIALLKQTLATKPEGGTWSNKGWEGVVQACQESYPQMYVFDLFYFLEWNAKLNIVCVDMMYLSVPKPEEKKKLLFRVTWLSDLAKKGLTLKVFCRFWKRKLCWVWRT